MDIGLKLKELRILKGLTQEELADRAALELRQGIEMDIECEIREKHRHLEQGAGSQFAPDGHCRNNADQCHGVGDHGLDGFSGI